MNTNTFEAPKMSRRIRSMVKLDFYRLFHTPAFYIMLLVSAMIPALMLTMGETSVEEGGMAITNAWQLIAGSKAFVSSKGFAGFATIDMIFIFAGLLMAIFVSHDYSSGFAKNIFAVHSKKQDYAISKGIAGVFSGVCMILAYVVGTVISGLITSKSFDINVGNLILCLLSKMSMMIAFCTLFLGIAIFFKTKLWLTIIATFVFGMLLYSIASFADLDATFLTLLLSLGGSALLGVGFTMISKTLLSKRDLS